MAGKRFDVCTPRAKKDGGTYWHRVGTAFEGEKGINILFDSLPMPDKDGRCSISLFEPRERQSGAKPTQSGGGSDMNDEIPFAAEFR